MEPDIIRMYSSSPPPLDNGAEDDEEDEFGEFGGFSEVSPSGVGFVDFDTPDYTRPKEDFVLSTTSKEMIPSKTLDPSIDGMESLEDLDKVVVQGPSTGQLRSFSPGDFRTDKNIVHQTKQLESCNGEKPPCLEILTNGFAGLETVNPQGTDDLDNVADSKGSKPLNTCGTECILESAASHATEFADFSTFSQTERTQLEEIECPVLNDGDTLTIQGNSKGPRVKELNCVKEVTLDGSFEDTGNTEREHQVCVSEIHAVADRGLSVEKQDLQTLQQDESHHLKEVWQSQRTDETMGTLGTPKMHSVSSAASKGAVASGHLQEPGTSVQTALLNRLERIFEACFPSVFVPDVEEEVSSLKHLLETHSSPAKTREALADRGELRGVWTELQDIHDAHGLRYQWGGSHSNKKLLCSLGIDTRNILFTGNKKQPVIVPMYAAGLGMLEPTKEPLKPLSAAEKIASIGQTTVMTPEINTCTSDPFQESLPPVQFDWSSSGLTNPLDGVDPELYELTTAKLETSTSSLRVTDAFAKLMSTVEKTSTSTRKPKREEHLSEEAMKVIASLPDLTFMHAKVLMFPATLTPSMSSQEQADA